jgi:hypothetical protein
MTKDEYHVYLHSPQWHIIRMQKLAQANYRCEFRPMTDYGPGERCCTNRQLEIHHRTYANVGHEKLEDLMVLCRFHHLVVEIIKLVFRNVPHVTDDELIVVQQKAIGFIDRASGVLTRE